MKKIVFSFLLNFVIVFSLHAQQPVVPDHYQKAIHKLIDQYSEARENSDTALLKKILTSDVDQLVSTGEWRRGLHAATEGMLKSSGSRPGTRTLKVDNIRLLNINTAIVDCRYEIHDEDSTSRKMWSTFMIVSEKNTWKITAIRNMLPSNN